MRIDMSRYTVVLVRAQEAGNVGASCRAMKTMGLRDLVLVNCSDFDSLRVATMAVHAFDVYEHARRYEDLAAALAEFSLVVGFTRRRGSKRKSQSLSVRDFAGSLPDGDGKIALVFGNERDGLSDEELAYCSLAAHIPSSDNFPSLNLAQAVQVVCYELFTSTLGDKDGSADPVARELVEKSVARIAEALANIGFFVKTDNASCKIFLRDIIERAGMGGTELRYFEQLFLRTVAVSDGRGSPRRHKKSSLSSIFAIENNGIGLDN